MKMHRCLYPVPVMWTFMTVFSFFVITWVTGMILPGLLFGGAVFLACLFLLRNSPAGEFDDGTPDWVFFGTKKITHIEHLEHLVRLDERRLARSKFRLEDFVERNERLLAQDRSKRTEPNTFVSNNPDLD